MSRKCHCLVYRREAIAPECSSEEARNSVPGSNCGRGANAASGVAAYPPLD